MFYDKQQIMAGFTILIQFFTSYLPLDTTHSPIIALIEVVILFFFPLLIKKAAKLIKYFFYIATFFLMLAELISLACDGSKTKGSPEAPAISSNYSPTIAGTPPPVNPVHNPYKDTGLVSQYIRSIFQDSKGHFWFGPAGQSVVSFDGKTLKYFSEMEFFHNHDRDHQDYGSDVSVHAIAEDQKGHLWFGTHHGVIRYDGKSFKRYNEKNGLANIKVGRKSVLADRAGTLWVGTQRGVFRYNPVADSAGLPCFSPFSWLDTLNVSGIMEVRSGHIWFTSPNQGVFRYNGKTINSFTAKEGLGDNYAGGIAQDESGKMWFTMQGGICSYDGKTFTEITTKDGLGGHEIWGLFIEKSGIIWVTARGSTTRYDPAIPISDAKAFTVFTVKDGLNCCVQSMYQDRSGRMWWGTGQGLYRFDGYRFYQVKQTGPWL